MSLQVLTSITHSSVCVVTAHSQRAAHLTEHKLQSRLAWLLTPTVLLTYSVTLHGLLNLSVPRVLACRVGITKNT